MKYYIASCMFTSKFPDLSQKIQDYVSHFSDIKIVRCCVPGWKKDIYEQKINLNTWKELPQSHVFDFEDIIYSLCPNCMNITEEWRNVKEVHSLWELIDQDPNFIFPNHSNLDVTIQDCYRMKERYQTHDSVRNLLSKMNIHFHEIKQNRNKADFCGVSLYKPQVRRNPKLAPKHYADTPYFKEHTIEEQKEIMKTYYKRYPTKTVVCYCHYCLEGFQPSEDIQGIHLAQLLFQ